MPSPIPWAPCTRSRPGRHNASSSAYTLTMMSWVAVIFTPIVLAYQAWSYWVFRKRIGVQHIPEQAPVTFALENANPAR